MSDPKPMPDGDQGQKPPTDETPVKQRHQLGTPPGDKDGGQETPAK